MSSSSSSSLRSTTSDLPPTTLLLELRRSIRAAHQPIPAFHLEAYQSILKLEPMIEEKKEGKDEKGEGKSITTPYPFRPIGVTMETIHAAITTYQRIKESSPAFKDILDFHKKMTLKGKTTGTLNLDELFDFVTLLATALPKAKEGGVARQFILTLIDCIAQLPIERLIAIFTLLEKYDILDQANLESVCAQERKVSSLEPLNKMLKCLHSKNKLTPVLGHFLCRTSQHPSSANSLSRLLEEEQDTRISQTSLLVICKYLSADSKDNADLIDFVCQPKHKLWNEDNQIKLWRAERMDHGHFSRLVFFFNRYIPDSIMPYHDNMSIPENGRDIVNQACFDFAISLISSSYPYPEKMLMCFMHLALNSYKSLDHAAAAKQLEKLNDVLLLPSRNNFLRIIDILFEGMPRTMDMQTFDWLYHNRQHIDDISTMVFYFEKLDPRRYGTLCSPVLLNMLTSIRAGNYEFIQLSRMMNIAIAMVEMTRLPKIADDEESLNLLYQHIHHAGYIGVVLNICASKINPENMTPAMFADICQCAGRLAFIHQLIALNNQPSLTTTLFIARFNRLIQDYQVETMKTVTHLRFFPPGILPLIGSYAGLPDPEVDTTSLNCSQLN